MKPALSVILFTVSSGAGLGMLFWLALSRLAHAGAPSQSWWIAATVAVVLLTVGLIASTGHLANPKNAWRAFSRFRTSWLSREGVFAVALYVVGGLYVLALLTQAPHALVSLLGLAVMALSLAVLICTGMIYACLKTIPRWHNWHTRFAYPLLGLFSGSLLVVALIPAGGQLVLRWVALLLLVLAAIVKWLYFRRFQEPGGPRLADALKQSRGEPRLLDVGHTHPSFLMREFGFNVAPQKAAQMRLALLVLSFALPALILLLWPAASALAAVSCLAGLFAERWLFFAEARHVVRLYHGERQV